MSCGAPSQSSGHSAHIGQDVVIHYRWHPLYGRSARRIQGEQRGSGEFVHVELTPGAVTILPGWKLDAVYCAGLKVGAPQVSLSALCALDELLIACESRLVSSNGSTVTQEAHDGISGTAHTKNEACSEAASLDPTPAPTRPRSRRRATSGYNSGAAPDSAESACAAPARGSRRGNAGGRR
jgi:hypothetical protein